MQLISKFNKLIRNRFVWGAFAFIICCVFVLAGVSTRGCGGGSAPGKSVEGTLAGEDVSSMEFGMARFYEMYSRQAPETPEDERILRRRTWTRIAAMKEAEKLGITVPDDYLGRLIVQEPSFQIEGRFSKDLYEKTIRGQGMTRGVFEQYLRESFASRALASVLQAAVWTPNSEVQEELSARSDLFTTEYVILAEDKFAKDVTADEEKVAAYYESNKQTFEVPEKARVKYVAFPVSNYLAGATELVDDLEVGMFYTNNLVRYTSTDTNGVSTIQPIEEVKEDIRMELERNEARYMAREKARDFAALLLPSRYQESTPLEKAAEKEGLAVSTTGYFTVSEYLPGIDSGLEFSQAAFELDAGNPEDAVSEAIEGTDHFYIAHAIDRQEAYIPPFEQVKEQAEILATELEKRSVLIDRAQEIRDEIEDKVMEGMSFAEAAAGYELNVVTTQPFNAYEGVQEELPGAMHLPMTVVRLVPGEISEPTPTAEGALIAYVSSRVMGNMAMMADVANRLQVIQYFDQMKAGVLLNDWSEELLDRKNFVDNFPSPGESPAPVPEDNSEEESDESEEAVETEAAAS